MFFSDAFFAWLFQTVLTAMAVVACRLTVTSENDSIKVAVNNVLDRLCRLHDVFGGQRPCQSLTRSGVLPLVVSG